MNLTSPLAEGKTKIVYPHPDDPALAVLYHKDGITAGDGARRNEIPGKGAVAGRTTANVFALLNRAGIATHFVAAPAPHLTVVRRCTMIPLEVVMRRLATGSYLKRFPAVAEGTRFAPPLVEFFLKDDARHDPLVTPDEITQQQIATSTEVATMMSIGRQVFATLEQAWAILDVTLVDLKIEFGRPGVVGTQPAASLPYPALHHAPLLVADVIDNDSWRIWPAGEKARMLDKQLYRNAQVVDDALLAEILQRYTLVAELTDGWG
jgi:phosphoribosylaminoimidazole-succinocarboxamide synthase